MYKVYWESNFQAEFETLREAREYVKSAVKDMSKACRVTQKWVREHFEWKIEEE